MPSLDTLRAMLADPPDRPMALPDAQRLIQLGRRRRALRRLLLGAGVTVVVAGTAVAVNTSALTVAPLPWSAATSGDVITQPVLAPAAGSPSSAPDLVPSTATSPPGPATSAAPVPAPVTTTAPPSPPSAAVAPSAIEIPTTIPAATTGAYASAPTGTLRESDSGTEPGVGSGGLGMPDGGGTTVGQGVPVSPTGRYAFSMICTGNWQGRALQVSFRPLSAPSGNGPVAGTFDCRGEQQDVSVSIDGPTVDSLRRSGTMALMMFTVVGKSPGGGYVGIGPTLFGMSVTMGNIRPDGAAIP